MGRASKDIELRDGLRGALMVLSVSLAIELGWCRVSSRPLSPFDIGVELSFFLLGGLAPALVLAAWGRWRQKRSVLPITWAMLWSAGMLLLGLKRMLAGHAYVPGPASATSENGCSGNFLSVPRFGGRVGRQRPSWVSPGGF